MSTIDRITRLQIDVDTRLLALWAETARVDEWTLEMVGDFMRAAYAKGHADALREANPHALYLSNGYHPPRRGA